MTEEEIKAHDEAVKRLDAQALRDLAEAVGPHKKQIYDAVYVLLGKLSAQERKHFRSLITQLTSAVESIPVIAAAQGAAHTLASLAEHPMFAGPLAVGFLQAREKILAAAKQPEVRQG